MTVCVISVLWLPSAARSLTAVTRTVWTVSQLLGVNTRVLLPSAALTAVTWPSSFASVIVTSDGRRAGQHDVVGIGLATFAHVGGAERLANNDAGSGKDDVVDVGIEVEMDLARPVGFHLAEIHVHLVDVTIGLPGTEECMEPTAGQQVRSEHAVETRLGAGRFDVEHQPLQIRPHQFFAGVGGEMEFVESKDRNGDLATDATDHLLGHVIGVVLVERAVTVAVQTDFDR